MLAIFDFRIDRCSAPKQQPETLILRGYRRYDALWQMVWVAHKFAVNCISLTPRWRGYG